MKIILSILYLMLTTYGLSQTTGPVQPEAIGFKPIDANNLVDLVSGDFTYNLPLFTIPGGPEGMPYPVNINYSSNVDMETPASVVGLGWNMNTGAIQRNLRGLPDDFSGEEEIEQTQYMKPNYTVKLNNFPRLGNAKEVFGLDFLKLKPEMSMFYNNYSGIGIDIGLDLDADILGDETEESEKGEMSLGMSFNNEEGFSLSPDVSYQSKLKKNEEGDVVGGRHSAKIGATFNSKQGFQDIDYSYVHEKNEKEREFGGSYASSSPLQSFNQKRNAISFSFGFTLDLPKTSLPKDQKSLEIAGTFIRSWVDANPIKRKAYGTMYMQNWQDTKGSENTMTDFYRESSGQPNKKMMQLPFPVLTYDEFSIQAQGIVGTFRTFQNSVGRLSEPVVHSRNISSELGVEVGIGARDYHIGADLSLTYGDSYSGPWTNENSLGEIRNFNFNKRNFLEPLYEPSYFKIMGEPNFLDLNDWNDWYKEEPIAFNIQVGFNKTRAFSKFNRTNNEFRKNYQSKRTKRATQIEYFTKNDLQNSDIVTIVDSTSIHKFQYNQGEGSQINGFSIINTNGIRYNFMLPAYNSETIRKTFSIPSGELKYGSNSISIDTAKVIDYVDSRPVSDFETIANDTKLQYYYEEKIPAYATSYFLTSILSQDYVDLMNDGPSDDDLGTYVKFNYFEQSDYHWRFPFEGFYYSRGYLDDDEDDKASYQSGIKKLYNIQSIETKKYIAIFSYENAQTIDANHNATKNKKLTEINLYSKSSKNYTENFYLTSNTALWPKPIQTIKFDYDYELRPNSPNSTATYKKALTLKQVTFTYQDSKKGNLTPYRFEYGNRDVQYQAHQQDMWGAYQPNHASFVSTSSAQINVNENPFTYQEENYGYRDANASAWLLNKITLPSKAEIEVKYEKDNYAYVQNKKAMSFFEIVGTNDTFNLSTGMSLDKEKLYVFYKSPVPLTQTIVDNQVSGIEYLKFRIFTKLKKDDTFGEMASDYVEGYAELDGEYGVADATNNIGYIKLKSVRPKPTSTNDYHPFRLAAFQYIRKTREDLGPDYDLDANVNHFAFVSRYVTDMLTELASLFGYYATANAKGYASELDDEKPSYIRLVNTNKYGDGSRVKQITFKSNDVNESVLGKVIYGKEYKYILEDGVTSSGVAESEPLVGVSECVLSQPIFPNNRDKIIFTNGGYLPETLGLGLYPNPRVDYSRVSIRNLAYDDPKNPSDRITYSQSGVVVNEFYTGKDFPTFTDSRGTLLAPLIFNVTVPFIGTLRQNQQGYSQGYTFEDNSAIYGKPKSVATYPYSVDEPSTQPIQKVVYNYKTEVGNSKKLSSEVTVLEKEGVKQTVLLNKERDFYVDETESNSLTINSGGQPNVNLTYPPIAVVPNFVPLLSRLKRTTRYIVTNKMIRNYPVLESIDQYKDGAKVTTNNLYYDSDIGEPIITSLINEWENPVYHYEFPAHWSYEEMKGAYKNYRGKLQVSQSGTLFKIDNGTIAGVIPQDLLQNGDLLRNDSDGLEYYVNKLNRAANTFELKSRDNSNATAGNYTIMQSGYQNLQSFKKGNLVSLDDYANIIAPSPDAGMLALIHNYNLNRNNFIGTFGPPLHNQYGNFSLEGCNSSVQVNTYYSHNFFVDDGKRGAIIFGDSCIDLIFIPIEGIQVLDNLDASKLAFIENSYNGNSISMIYLNPRGINHGKIIKFNISGSNSCDCETLALPILQASALQFDDQWPLEYSKLESESTDIGHTLTEIKQNNLGNPWAFGLLGKWKPIRSWAYLEKRDQSGTSLPGERLRLSKDGTFNFKWFVWNESNEFNEDNNWRWTNEMITYNPNGYSQEGRNPLNIYSSSILGYKGHLVTASAQNAEMSEIVFDGFEDYNYDNNLNYRTNSKGHGNINFQENSSGNYTFPLSPNGHTGKFSLSLYGHNLTSIDYYKYATSMIPTIATENFRPVIDKKYYLSFWTKSTSQSANVNFDNVIPDCKIELRSNNTVIEQFTVHPNTSPIDGWYKVSGVFTVPNSIGGSAPSDFEIRLYKVNGKDIWVDDLRIQPFKSGMETYVYDPETYRLRATLNNQNFATFYDYDEEGNVIGTKVETEEGIQSISSNRSNIHQN